MTQTQLLTLAANKYPHMNATVFIRQELSREQYKQVERLWGCVMDPYRESADFYCLTFGTDDDPIPLVQYLEQHKIKYALELEMSKHEDLL